MSELKVTYTQECDLCHKVVKTDKYGLEVIVIPHTTCRKWLKKLIVCPDCTKRLGHVIANYIEFDVKSGARWKEDVEE